MDEHCETGVKATKPAGAAYQDDVDELERLMLAISHSWEGAPEAARHVQQQVIPWFLNCSRVLDVCCGQGIFLELLREAGIAGEGIEGDPAMVKKALEKGLQVHLGTVPEGLKSIQCPFEGIFLGHIIEHFGSRDAVALLYYCLKFLNEGGIIAIQTPNSAHPNINSQFWLDITHVRPYPQLLLESMLRCQNCDILCSGPLSNSLDGNLDMLVVGRKRSRARCKQTGLVWAGLIYSSAGYGHEARAFIKAVNRERFDLKLISLGHAEEDLLNPHELASLKTLENAQVDLSQAVMVHHFPLSRESKDLRGRINIVRTMFETTGIPAEWVPMLSEIDEIWVPGSFNIETFSNCGIPRHKLRLVPSGVDCAVFHPAAPPLDLGPKKGFTFLSNFVFTDRKGWDLLLTAYFTEFRPDEDVDLLIKTYGVESAINARIGSFIQERFPHQQFPPFRVFVARLHNSMLPGLYTACDAFVLPSRGEAWGLPYIEAMACGLPAIGARWGGNLAFMNDDNSYPIEIEGLEDVPPHIDTPVLIGHKWAKPSVEHLRRQMRYVFEHRQEAQGTGGKAREDVCQHWTIEHAAAVAQKELLKYCDS